MSLMMTVTTEQRTKCFTAVLAFELTAAVCLLVPGEGLLTIKHLLAGVTLVMPPVMNLLVTAKICSQGGLIVTHVTSMDMGRLGLTFGEVTSERVDTKEPMTVLTLLDMMSPGVLVQLSSVAGSVSTGIAGEDSVRTVIFAVVVIITLTIITLWWNWVDTVTI